jgi:predicted metal-dependent hydrolase
VSDKSGKVREFVRRFEGGPHSPYYAGYFELFNEGKFYESHDVLEQLWLEDRKGPDGDFFKGLIQLAGAFVHLQKHRLGPAAALFNLSRANLKKYPAFHRALELSAVVETIDEWLELLQAGTGENPLPLRAAPVLRLK